MSSRTGLTLRSALMSLRSGNGPYSRFKSAASYVSSGKIPLPVKNPSRNLTSPPLCSMSTHTLGTSSTGMYTRWVCAL